MAQFLTITLMQANLAWEDKQSNLDYFETRIRALDKEAEVVVLPEMFSTGFTMNATAMAEEMDGPTVTWMKNLAAEKRIILTGSLIIHEHGQYYNRLLWVLPDGKIGQYDKKHLFGYAGETEHYTAGQKRLIASVKGWKVNLLICYDLRFPVWSRQQLQDQGAEYDLLIYVANWPSRRNIAWKTLLQARAIENQCYVVGVNRVGTDGNDNPRTGDSMVVDPLGAVIYHKANEEDVFSFRLDKEHLDSIRTKLPFLGDGDSFLLMNNED